MSNEFIYYASMVWAIVFLLLAAILFLVLRIPSAISYFRNKRFSPKKMASKGTSRMSAPALPLKGKTASKKLYSSSGDAATELLGDIQSYSNDVKTELLDER